MPVASGAIPSVNWVGLEETDNFSILVKRMVLELFDGKGAISPNCFKIMFSSATSNIFADMYVISSAATDPALPAVPLDTVIISAKGNFLY